MHGKKVGIDMDGDGVVDGFYEIFEPTQEEPKEPKEPKVRKINLVMQPTVEIRIDYKLDNNRSISIGVSRQLQAKETTADAHRAIYKECLESLNKLIK